MHLLHSPAWHAQKLQHVRIVSSLHLCSKPLVPTVQFAAPAAICCMTYGTEILTEDHHRLKAHLFAS